MGAPLTESNHAPPTPIGPVRFAPSSRRHNAPWLSVVKKYAKKMPGMTLGRMYKMLGWGPGRAYGYRSHPDLKLSVLARMAVALNAPMGQFMKDVAEAQGWEPLAEPRSFNASRGSSQNRTSRAARKKDLALSALTPRKRKHSKMNARRNRERRR